MVVPSSFATTGEPYGAWLSGPLARFDRGRRLKPELVAVTKQVWQVLGRHESKARAGLDTQHLEVTADVRICS